MVGFISLAGAMAVGGIVAGMALVASGGFNPKNPSFEEKDVMVVMERLVSNIFGVAAVILPSQLTMLAVALGAAFLSPERVGSRLGYARGSARWWMLPLLLLGTMFMGMVGGLATDALFTEHSANIRMIVAMARIPNEAEFIGVLIMLSVVPAVVEETLFRGYIQRRLLQRWTPLAAIATSTAFFALAHFDVQHTFAVIPLGVWLGYIAWRTSSLWPGMICHAAQNVFALLSTRYGDLNIRGLQPEMIPMLVVAGLGFAGAVGALHFRKLDTKPQQS